MADINGEMVTLAPHDGNKNFNKCFYGNAENRFVSIAAAFE